MPGLLSKFAGTAALLALLASPAGAIASSSATTPSTQSAANAWTTLSVMSTGASAATVAAAQGDVAYDRRGIPLPVIGVWLATLGVFIWIVTRDNDGDDFDFGPFPISPA